MVSPRIEIELNKLVCNARRMVLLFGVKGINITAVTKGVCGSPIIARSLLRGGIRSIGDSRIANIRRMRKAGLEAKFVLLRSPMPSEVEGVVEFVDVSLNTELSVIQLLSRHAVRRGKIHGIILMVELGDLREGIMPRDIGRVIEEALGLPGIRLDGIGTNLSCFGGVKPTKAKMGELSALVDRLQRVYGLHFTTISGGNSANFKWFESASDVGSINNLRLGECILLGRETLAREHIPGLYTDAFTLIAEVIECKVKPSKPYGEIAQNAFGHTPVFENKGNMRRAILALGRQDVEVSGLKPRIAASVLGASSDHLILDVRDSGLKVGDEVRFDVNYAALIRAMMSPYVHKKYVPVSSYDKVVPPIWLSPPRSRKPVDLPVPSSRLLRYPFLH